MSDELDRELELRLRAIFVGVPDADWGAVQARARRRAPSRMLFVALGGAAAVLAFGSQAFGVGPQVESIFRATPPPPVTRILGGHRVRLAAALRSRDGRAVRLWRADRSNGTTCELFTIAGHAVAWGCGRAPAASVGAVLMTSDIKGHPARPSDFIGGFARAGTRRVQLVFADGSRREITPRAGAWIAEIPWGRRRSGHNLVRVETLDASGGVTASARFAGLPSPTP